MEKNIKKIVLFLVLFLILPNFSLAAPSISRVSGTISDGRSITINGSGFGTVGPNVVLFDDFEKGTNGNTLSLVSGSAQVSEWSRFAQNYYPTYSTSFANSGTKAMKSDYNVPENEHTSVDKTFAGTDRVYISYWTYIDSSSCLPGASNIGGNLKLVLISDDPWPGSDITYVAQGDLTDEESQQSCLGAWYDSAGLYTGDQDAYGWLTSSWRKGIWHRWESYLYGLSSNGIFRIWETDSANARKQIQNTTAFGTKHDDDMWRMVRFPAYHRSDVNSVQYWDDIYVATGPGAQSRIEIGNNESYSSCTNLAVATVNSWSANSISATVRSGSFSSDPAFLFVVDSSGIVSDQNTSVPGDQGYQINLVSGGGDDTTAPNVPSGLYVN